MSSSSFLVDDELLASIVASKVVARCESPLDNHVIIDAIPLSERAGCSNGVGIGSSRGLQWVVVVVVVVVVGY
jgi:hypothetical protein